MSVSEMVEQQLPVGRGYSPERAQDAAETVGYLVRYLNYATGPFGACQTLRFASDAYRLMSDIGEAVRGLDQLLAQVRMDLAVKSTDPSLYDDRRDRPAAQTAEVARVTLAKARGSVGVLVADLSRVSDLMAHLGNDDTD